MQRWLLSPGVLVAMKIRNKTWNLKHGREPEPSFIRSGFISCVECMTSFKQSERTLLVLGPAEEPVGQHRISSLGLKLFKC